MAALINPNDPNRAKIIARELQSAANTLGLQLHVLNAGNDRDFDSVFADMVQLRVGGLVIGGDPLFNSRSQQLGNLALQHSIPAIYQLRSFAASGGLIGYGARLVDTYRLVGVYAGRVLKGEKPADLPVQQATEIELIINLKTAKTLGVTIPLPLLGRADEVIE
jgi:putative ABC transport system substrate-binding protein